MFGGATPPPDWALCDGQLLPIAVNIALFAVIGTIYGGDGKSYFALPNLQGLSPLDQGQGSGLTDRYIGEQGGENAVTLTTAEIPPHIHLVQASTAPGTASDPANGYFAAGHWTTSSAKGTMETFNNAGATLTRLNSGAIGSNGGGLPHNNLMPYQVVNFIICLDGIFPPKP